VTQTELQPMTITPGTSMWKVIPPRLVGPYLNGQRSVIAGFVHLARDTAFREPAEAFVALGLGYDGSEFTPDMPELHYMCWAAKEIDSYIPAPGPSGPGEAPGGGPDLLSAERPALSSARVRVIPEFYTGPMPIPVGTVLCRLTAAGDEPIARYDGLAWQRQQREA
jgi:hypothetical protein